YNSKETKDIILLKEILTVERMFKLMTSGEKCYYHDTLNKLFAAIRFLKAAKSNLSFLAKCRTFDEMQEKIFRDEKFAKLTNIKINQDILEWDLHLSFLSSGHQVIIPNSSY